MFGDYLWKKFMLTLGLPEKSGIFLHAYENILLGLSFLCFSWGVFVSMYVYIYLTHY